MSTVLPPAGADGSAGLDRLAGAPSVPAAHTEPAADPAEDLAVDVPAQRRLPLLGRASGETVDAPAPPGPPAEPVPLGDLLTLRLLHRLARRDTASLAAAAEGLASGTAHFSDKRALAFGDWVERVCEEIGHHHAAEDELIWPLLELHAGPAVDLADLSADHEALHSLLGEVRRGARGVVAALILRPAAVATARDFERMRELAARLAELAELVEEHLTDTERVVLDAVTAHVPRGEWGRMLRLLDARGDGWSVPRLLAVATSDEAAALQVRHGLVVTVAQRVAVLRLRRRERLVYGPAAGV